MLACGTAPPHAARLQPERLQPQPLEGEQHRCLSSLFDRSSVTVELGEVGRSDEVAAPQLWIFMGGEGVPRFRHE